MAPASAIFLTLSLTLAVLFGAQTNAWAWGPALICLMIAMAAALGHLLKQPSRMLNGAFLAVGSLTLLWFGIRALRSPVEGLAQADLLLLCACFGGFVSVLAVQSCRRATAILTAGIAALLFANLVVMVIQLGTPGFSALSYKTPDSRTITGFFSHYNYAANYLLVSSLWLLGQAWHSRHRLLQVGLGLLGGIGLLAIYWTKSRGGLLAAIVALACFGLLILIEAKRRKAKWFPLAAIGLPFVALILLGLLINGWESIQAARNEHGPAEVRAIMDNTVRLNYLGIAVSTVSGHVLIGGGSRSYSWECFQHWDATHHGSHFTKPEFVHNEWMQAATDYGLLGFSLVFALMAVVAISAILRVSFEPKPSEPGSRPILRLGGFAALIGMLAQINFSFIFHLMPGALMLGMCLAASCQWNNKERPSAGKQHLQRGLLGFFGLMALIIASPLAWKGTQVMAALWPSHYSKDRELHAAHKLKALDRAIEIWPQASLLLKRGMLHHGMANSAQDEDMRSSFINEALSDYTQASELHPFLAEAAINRATLLSELGRDGEAEQAYQRAIELQGGMEPSFRAHYLYALHLRERGRQALLQAEADTALTLLQRAAEHIGKATLWQFEERAQEISIHEALGLAYEINDQPEEALASYEHAATIHYGDGRRIHFRSALLQATQANQRLLERDPSAALGLFLKARASVDRAGGQLPTKITAEQREEFLRLLDERIRRLREIGITAP